MKKVKKIAAVVLIGVLLLTSMPQFFAKVASATETTWKVLEEKDLPVDELYGWHGNLMVGRKDGKVALMDSNMQLVKKTEYDQIEGPADNGLLVSRPMDKGNEYASIDKMGKITVYGIYKKLEYLYLIGIPLMYAEKVNGECGFVYDGKEIGFDKVFVDKPESAVVKYNIVTIGKSMYYVKQYFETEDVYDEMGGFFYGMSMESMKEMLHAQQCEFVFYDETGTVIDIEPLIRKYEEIERGEEEQKKQDAQVIEELERIAESQMPIREYINNTWKWGTGKYIVNDVTGYRFGDGYLAYVKTDVEFDFEEHGFMEFQFYFAGFFDREKKLVKFGQVIAARNEEYWDEGIYLTIRDNDKKIYFYGDDDYANTGNMVKYLYTDTDGSFTDDDGDLKSAYPDRVILDGYKKYLVANPMNDFVTTTSMSPELYGENALNLKYAVLYEKNGIKQVMFYDEKWKEMKSIDVSHINKDIELCSGIVLGKSCALLYKTESGYYGLIGMDGSNVVDAEQEKYTYASAKCSFFEKSHVLMEKDGRDYYYYGDDLFPHTEEEYENWEASRDDVSGDDEREYGDIKYVKDYLYDEEEELISVCEKVTDCDGNVIVNHEVTGEVYERDGYNDYIYIFKDCKSIIVVDQHWSGKREEKPEKVPPTPDVTTSPTPDIVATPTPTEPSNNTTQTTKPTEEPNKQNSLSKGTVLKDKKNEVSYRVLAQDRVEFYKADNKEMSKITIPSAVSMDGVKFKVTDISDNAFNGCKKLKSVTIGKSVTTIGNKAFSKCTSLKKITIPTGVTKIGKKAFYGCKKLKTITIKSKKLNSKSVGAQAFKGLHKKAVIKVPKKQKKAYTKWLKKKGITKKMKIK